MSDKAKVFILVAIYCLFMGLVNTAFEANSSEDIVTVRMFKMKFIPKRVVVKKGQTLVFVNEDRTIHNVVFPSLKKRSKFIRKGKKVSFKMDKTGTFKYYCQPHRNMGMTGTVEVTDGENKIQSTRSHGIRDQVQNNRGQIISL